MSVIADDTDHPYNLHLGQHLLAGLTLEHLERTGLGDVRFGHRVERVTPADGRVSVTVETPAGPRVLRGGWLVGADGARSTVRETLGLGFDGMTWPERFVAVNLHYDFEAHGFARANFVLDPDDWRSSPCSIATASGGSPTARTQRCPRTPSGPSPRSAHAAAPGRRAL